MHLDTMSTMPVDVHIGQGNGNTFFDQQVLCAPAQQSHYEQQLTLRDSGLNVNNQFGEGTAIIIMIITCHSLLSHRANRFTMILET